MINNLNEPLFQYSMLTSIINLHNFSWLYFFTMMLVVTNIETLNRYNFCI